MKFLKPLSALVVIGVAILASPALANPPYAGLTYSLFANNSWVGMLKISRDAASLADGSFVNAGCITNAGSTLFTVHMNLGPIQVPASTGIGTVTDTITINNPAGVIGSTFLGPERVSGQPPGTGSLGSPRFFFRFFPSNSGPPTSGPPPQGPPTGGTASGPGPGDIGTGTIGARNNPPKVNNQFVFADFCSFSLNLFGVTPIPKS